MYSFKPSVLALSLLAALSLGSGVNAQTIDRAAVKKNIESLKDQVAAHQALFLAPSPEDTIKYARFLRLPDTGLCRILPRDDKEDIGIRGGGSYYSFVRLTHEYGYGSEIGLERGELYTSFAGADLGFITSIGDVQIDTVDLRQPAADFLANYEAPEAEPAVREEQRRLMMDGIEGGGYVFHRSAEAKLNTTYVMRAVEYDTSDVLVVFRVVGQDTDGSLTILWRILQRFQTPKLIRAQQQ